MQAFSHDQLEKYMRLTIEIARQNPSAAFGTVLVDHELGQVVGEGVNQVTKNPILHGEIDAILRYAENGGLRWSNLSLFTTAEPCCMCQAAIMWAGIPRVVYGTSISKLVELGWTQFCMTAEDVTKRAPFAQCELLGGVLKKECDRLFNKHKSDP